MSKALKKPLKERLWHEEPFAELVKIIGYEGCRVSECYERAKWLLEKFGQRTMEEVAMLITRMEGNDDSRMVYLNDDARRHAWPILGPDPKNPPWWAQTDELFSRSRRSSRKRK